MTKTATLSVATQQIRDILLETLSHVQKRPIQLHEPWFCGNESQYTQDCVASGWVSSVGQYVDQFSENLARTTAIPYVVPMVNGTAALHLCLKLLGVQPQDEVLVPALTFVATANAIAYAGAIPHFVASEAMTLGIDPDALGEYLDQIATRGPRGIINRFTGRPIKALIVVHVFGLPAQLEKLAQIADFWGLPLIEDVAESLGSYYQGQHTGSFGILSAMSFNGNKIVTTGGGGAILTKDPQLAERAKYLSTTAKQTHPWAFYHTELGYNYRMPNINAALGCAQLEMLPLFLEKKRTLAKIYQHAFENNSHVQFITELHSSRSNYWLNTLKLSDELVSERETLIAACQQAGLMLRPAWHLLSDLPMYHACPRMDLTTTTCLANALVNIPSSAFLAPA